MPFGESRPRIVVVGYGMVAHRLLESLVARGLTEEHDVVVLGEERQPAYDRVALSTAFTSGGAEQLRLDDAAFRDDRAVRITLGDPAVGLDAQRRVVTTRSGRIVGYDVCVLATGAVPWVPPVPGLELAGTWTYRTLDDLDAIAAWARAHGNRPGVVVGGGLLGLEAANALRVLGLETHVVELAPHLMPASSCAVRSRPWA